jgi:hypothetical protein
VIFCPNKGKTSVHRGRKILISLMDKKIIVILR